MIKIVHIALILFLLIASCGKKGDPIFKENGKNFKGNKITVVL